jgi:hypothetical protein
MCLDIPHHPEDRKGRGHLFEFRQWCILVHGHMGSRSRCSLQVRPQDGGAPFGGNLFEVDLLTTAASEHRSSPGGTDVVDPLHVLSEHRHQVPLSLDDGHHHRQRDRPPGLASGHFQGHQVVGRDARRGDSSSRSIQHPRDPVGSLPTIQPVGEVASHQFLILRFTIPRRFRSCTTALHPVEGVRFSRKWVDSDVDNTSSRLPLEHASSISYEVIHTAHEPIFL